jgi:multidrug resistance efflux pump
MRRKWALVSVAAIVVAGAAGGGVALLRRNRAAAPPIRAAGAVSLPSMAAGLTLTGTIRAQNVLNFGATTKGNIEAFMAEVGDEVAEGQTVARVGASGLETDRENAANDVNKAQDRVTRAEGVVNGAILEESRASAELEKARLTLDKANKDYARQTTLIAAGATPRLTYEASGRADQAAQDAFDIMDKAWRAASNEVQLSQQMLDAEKKNLADAVDRLQSVQNDLDETEVRAPTDGWLVARQGQIGQPAEDYGDKLFQLATDLAQLEVTVEPKPEVLKRIVPGMPALVLIPELTNAAIEGDVKAIDGNQAVVEFVSPMPSVRPGMKADVRLKLD